MAYRGLTPTVGTETVRGQAAVNYVSTPSSQDTAVVKAGAAAQYFTSDGSGNVAILTDSAGAQVCATRFDPFGNPLNNSCTTAVTPNTHYWQDARQEPTGQYQFGSRTYDPAKGAFLTPDANQGQQPSKDLSVQVDPLTANTYTYVNGDPVNLVDPTGHEPHSSFTDTNDPCYGTHVTPASCHGAQTAALAFANATQTHVQLDCIHHSTDDVTCGSIEPVTPSLTRLCKLWGASACSPFATLYGPAANPATADSPWVIDAANSFEQALLNQRPPNPLNPRNPGLLPIGKILRAIWTHGVVSFGACLIICINGSLQGGHPSVSLGCCGIIDRGFGFGYANLPASQREQDSLAAGGAFVVGAGGSYGTYGPPRYNDPRINPDDWEFDVFPIPTTFGGYGAYMHSSG